MKHAALLLVTSLAACSGTPPSGNGAGSDRPVAAGSAAAAKPAEPALSQADAEKLGKAFATALQACDPGALDALMDVSEISKRSGLGGSDKLGADLCAGLGDSHSVRFSQVVMVDGAPRARIRVRTSGVNFMDLVLAKTGDTVRVTDVYNFRSGELLGETFKSLATLQSDPEGARAYIDAQKLYTAKQYAEAKKRFAEIPVHVRTTNKTIALLGLSIDYRTDDQTYEQAMADFAKNFPDDTALPFVLIDQYVMAKQHAKLIAALEALLARVGEDAYLRTLLAGARLEAGDHAGALADAKTAFAAEPDLGDARDVLLDTAVAAGDFDQAMVSLDASVKAGDDLAAIMKDLRANKAAAPFLASTQFKTWRSAHAVK